MEQIITRTNKKRRSSIRTLRKSQEEDLSSRLTVQEKRRTVYWTNFDPFIDLRMQWRASMMRHLFHILPGQKILEIGGGNGKFTRALSAVTRGGCDITTITFSPEYQDEIKETLKGCDINVVYLNSFPGLLAGEKFDYVVI